MKDLTKKIRDILAEELEVRVAYSTHKSVFLIVYVTARTIMRLFDEAFGEAGWSKKTTMLDKKSADTPFFAACSISVELDDGTVVTRDDVGEDWNSPKAAASDSLKRAAVNFIPALRALYTLPDLEISPDKLGIELSNVVNPKAEAAIQTLQREARKKELEDAVREHSISKRLSVSNIFFGDNASGRFIRAIQIVDEKTGDVVLEYKSKAPSVKTEEESEDLKEIKSLLEETGVDEKAFISDYKKHGVNTLQEIASTKNLRESAKVSLMGIKKKSKTAENINAQLKGEKKAKKKEE